MKIRLLTENLVSDFLWLAEWGFSAWIEHGDTKILFDTGFSDICWRNAETARIDPETVDFVALSHHHSDHTRGLLKHPFRSRKPLLVHPRLMTALDAPLVDEEEYDNGFDRIARRIRQDFDIVATVEPLEFAPDAFYLGQVPRVTPFERGTYYDDPMEDDTALAFRTDNGVVVVAGCSHAGICNICEHAKAVTGQKLYGVIGGFHLVHDEQPSVDDTIAYFQAEAPAHLLPVHCVAFDIQARMQQVFGYDRPGAGSLIEL